MPYKTDFSLIQKELKSNWHVSINRLKQLTCKDHRETELKGVNEIQLKILYENQETVTY